MPALPAVPGEGFGFFCIFIFTLVTVPRRSWSLELSNARVYEPQIRARIGTTVNLCAVPVWDSGFRREGSAGNCCVGTVSIRNNKLHPHSSPQCYRSTVGYRLGVLEWRCARVPQHLRRESTRTTASRSPCNAVFQLHLHSSLAPSSMQV